MAPPSPLPPHSPESPVNEASLREAVRAFLAEERFEPHCDAWLTGHDAGFSERLAARGFVGMAIPARYGGAGRTAHERHVVLEELLVAGAPVAAHWFADRQTAPLLLRYGSESQRRRFLPGIARGRCYFAIGLSEPDAGSDLSAIRASGAVVARGLVLNGRKVWTSHADRSHFLLVLCRTGRNERDRHAGLTQAIVDLGASGVEVRPLSLHGGVRHFNEVILDDVFVPEESVVGSIGDGWSQVMSELSFERSGPERLLSTFVLLRALVDAVGRDPDAYQAAALGSLIAELLALRRMSSDVAGALATGAEPNTEAALVKDLGTRFEQRVANVARLAAPDEGLRPGTPFSSLLAEATVAAPGFTLRGGTTEILRGIVARGLTT